MRKEELENKLSYYESQLTTYKAVTYDGIRSETYGNKVENNLIYVIHKIDEIKTELEKYIKYIQEYKIFLQKLNSKQKVLLEYLVETNLSKTDIAQRMNLSRSRIYSIIKKLQFEVAVLFLLY